MIPGRAITFFIAAGFALGASPVAAELKNVFSRDIETTVLIFGVDDVRADALPARFQARDIALIYSTQVIQACRALASLPGTRVAYDPLSGICAPIGAFPRELNGLAKRAFDAQAPDATEPLFLVVRPEAKGTPLPCTCKPELILNNGFEDDF